MRDLERGRLGKKQAQESAKSRKKVPSYRKQRGVLR